MHKPSFLQTFYMNSCSQNSHSVLWQVKFFRRKSQSDTQITRLHQQYPLVKEFSYSEMSISLWSTLRFFLWIPAMKSARQKSRLDEKRLKETHQVVAKSKLLHESSIKPQINQTPPVSAEIYSRFRNSRENYENLTRWFRSASYVVSTKELTIYILRT